MSGPTATRIHQATIFDAALLPLLVGVIAIPPGMFYFGLTSSMAFGTMIVCSIAILTSFMLLKISQKRFLRVMLFVFFLIICIALHLLISSMRGTVDLERGLASLLPLGICSVGGWAVAALLVHARDNALNRALKQCFLLLVVFAMLGVVGLQPPTTAAYSKPVFPFTEPSHLTLVFTPFLIFSCVSSVPWKRILYLIVAVLGAAFLENLTLVAACVLTTLVCLRLRHILLMIIFLAPIILSSDLSYYTERLVFDSTSQNLSALVYLQGWQMLNESWESTNGMGLGFQQLGVLGTNASAADQINRLLDNSLNLLDGGFNLAKILSEFGIFGAIFIVAYLYYLWRALKVLRSAVGASQQHSTVLLFASSCIVSYLIELLLRGAGYFTSTSVLLVSALFIWNTMRRSTLKFYLNK